MSSKYMTPNRAIRPSLVSLFLCLGIPAWAQSVAPAPQVAQDAWNDDRVGMFVHWGLYSVAAGAWNGARVPFAAEWIQERGNIHSREYARKQRPQFAPDTNWAQNLARIAKNSGMRYVVITAKHHDGFTLFNSRERWSVSNPYGGSNISPAGRDLMRELVDAVRYEGLDVGFYYSVIDWQHPNAYRGSNGLPTPPVMFNGRTDENVPAPDPGAGSYKSYIYDHVLDLATNYGAISELWFDYSSRVVQDTDWNAEALMRMLRANQPNIMINNRLYFGLENNRGDLATPERSIPANGLPYNWETAQSWDNTSWGYRADQNGPDYKSPREAAMIIAEAASKGGNTLLNVGPDRFGRVPKPQADRMAALGAWMAVNGEAIYESRASGIDASRRWGRMTAHKSGDRYYAIVFNRPSDGRIDLSTLTKVRAGRRVSFSRLAKTGAINVASVNIGGSQSVFLNPADLDAMQSATIRANLGERWDNVARGKPTQSSSVYRIGNLELAPTAAVNGNTTGDLRDLFHTASNDLDPWFLVDLQGEHEIGEIVLHNRDSFKARLRDITIEVLDAQGRVVATYRDLNDANKLRSPDLLTQYLTDRAVVIGSQVRVRRTPDRKASGDDARVLAFSEIQVFRRVGLR